MSNILAIAMKELRGYFASPIAYIIIGFFALVFGWFYFVSISFFMQASLQMGMPGQGQININTMAIRPLLQNVSVVALFVLPLITMRSYAEEKRSGTIELLLTSPLTDACSRQPLMRRATGTSGDGYALSLIKHGPGRRPLTAAYVITWCGRPCSRRKTHGSKKL